MAKAAKDESIVMPRKIHLEYLISYGFAFTHSDVPGFIAKAIIELVAETLGTVVNKIEPPPGSFQIPFLRQGSGHKQKGKDGKRERESPNPNSTTCHDELSRIIGAVCSVAKLAWAGNFRPSSMPGGRRFSTWDNCCFAYFWDTRDIQWIASMASQEELKYSIPNSRALAGDLDWYRVSTVATR
ncbi:hypothetical protein BDP27DRAFT_1362720 [Rhodocollybia butyracea]|uniref:Uncharacterized protein n=1 Tax=Rhodocollybia butyracea TaxID=206335 RepID=A0A9P5PQE0_9AGAR|nr:hypothetical protein BDP27DRAFT_1362720 [Rhodocollybia butyracea]